MPGQSFDLRDALRAVLQLDGGRQRVMWGLCVVLALGCERQTGYCDKPDDCVIRVSKTMVGGSATEVGGAILSSPAGLFCDETCQQGQAAFALGVGVKLTVSAASGWRFAGWSGPCEGVAPTCTVVVGATPEVTARFVRKVCSQDGWCWENPLPTGSDLNGVWASSATDAWTVGAAGTILHWDGTSWRRTESTTSADLMGVWGSIKDAWAVGDSGIVLHWNGTAWSPSPQRTTKLLYAVWGSGATDVWAAGEGSTLLHFDGSAWSDTSQMALTNMGCDNGPRRLRSIWGSSRNDVWVVGACGTALHFTGTWARTDTATDTEIAGVGGSGPDDVWASASRLLLHWQGGKWSQTATPNPNIEKVWAANQGASLTWAVMASGGLLQRIGAEWYPVGYSVIGLASIAGSAVSDIWATGRQGTILHFDGASWSPTSSNLGVTNISGVMGADSNDVWAMSTGGGLVHWNGVAWSREPSPGLPSLLRIWVGRPNDLWVVGAKGTLLHSHDKGGWQRINCNTSVNLRTLWANGPDDVWAAGTADNTLTGAIVHYANGVCVADGPPGAQPGIWGIWGSGTEIWAVGLSGLVLHRRGPGDWVSEPGSTTEDFNRIAGASSGDLWAVSEDRMSLRGSILRRRSAVGRWEPVKTDIDPMVSIWVGADGTDIWAGGRKGVIWRSSDRGQTWTQMVTGYRGGALTDIWGTGPDSSGWSHIWAIGETAGAILHHQRR